MSVYNHTLFDEASLSPNVHHNDARPCSRVVPSLLKWTGSKRSQAATIAAYVPDHGRYYEPFLGGGAVMYIVAEAGAVGGDVYDPLIGFWRMVRDRPEALIRDYEAQWIALQANLPDYFYRVRDRFNKDRRPEDLNFLMRTCVNGIVRFSRSGQFNNSFHLSRRGMHPGRFGIIVRDWAEHVRGVEFRSGDYLDTTGDARVGDFVYLDPPYGGSKHRYIENIDTERLFCVLDQLNKRGVKWAVSFDGRRGDTSYEYAIPRELYVRKRNIYGGYSAVGKVLNGPVEIVTESLYLNY